jgi:hypothetical protein
VGEALLQGRTSTVMANLQIMAQVRHAGADTSALDVGGSALWQSHPLWSCGGKDLWLLHMGGVASCSCMRYALLPPPTNPFPPLPYSFPLPTHMSTPMSLCIARTFLAGASRGIGPLLGRSLRQVRDLRGGQLLL